MFFKNTKKQVNEVLKQVNLYSKMDNDQIKQKSLELKDLVQNKNVSLNSILPKAFALVYLMDSRLLKLVPYEVQIQGAINIHNGNIAEMKTGEGKTLVETMPAYLNALTGKGVHIVTVNEYLAQRDYKQMKPVFNALGLEVGISLSDMKEKEKREAYQADITYVTNYEVGFDYLRDNIALFRNKQVLRGLNYAIIDEVDNVLLDDARTPLILGGKATTNTDVFKIVDSVVKQLNRNKDVETDLEKNAAYLTESGSKHVEKALSIDDINDPKYIKLSTYINVSLKANFLMKRGEDYLVKHGKVMLIDASTGRVSPNRRFNDGLHQAIEAKEGVEVQGENSIVAQITYQNFFNLYTKMSGMTGTAETEKKEFHEVYNTKVVQIPTNKPNIRQDEPDRLYNNRKNKNRAIIQDIIDTNKNHQPVLVGTNDVNESEELSRMLDEHGLPHQVLNAATSGIFDDSKQTDNTEQNKKEAEIVAQAGQKDAITISTNMAGRGTDIKLGEGVKELGGLRVIGDERGKNRRIDNQLAGRAGRQGDPGSSIFYVSFEDKLIQEYSRERVLIDFTHVNTSNLTDDLGEIHSKKLIRSIREAQRRVEGTEFDQRKETLKYDKVDEAQRKTLYSQRQSLLEDDNGDILRLILTSGVDKYIENISNNLEAFKKMSNGLPENILNENNPTKLKELIANYLHDKYEENIQFCLDEDVFDDVKASCVASIDKEWTEYLKQLRTVKNQVSFSGYKQQESIVDYTFQTEKIFATLISSIQIDILLNIVNINKDAIKEQKLETEQEVQDKKKEHEAKQDERVEKTLA